jgi:hypothetical protein
MLANPGEAFEITAVSGQAPFFVRAGERRMSAYEPPVASAFANRRASMRIRALLDGGRDRTVIEGTLQVRDDIDAGKRDLAWIRLAVGGESVALYGHLERDRALGPQEWRFRSLAQSFSGKTAESLRAAEGVLFDEVPLQVVPVLSSPCDLYAMAVLAVRTLLANKQTTLAVALDEMTSLARSAANVSAKGDDLPGAIAGLFANDPRWAASLGPNRLVDDDVSPDLAFRFVPPAFWWETLAMMARMLPGVGPFSACRDYADAPAGGLHTVFDRSVADAERLILWSRELIVDNRPMNSEVQKALRAFLSKARESAGSV